MKARILFLVLIFLTGLKPVIHGQIGNWLDLNSHFPDTINTGCLSDISCLGDTCWITSCMPNITYLYYSTDGCQTITTKPVPAEPNAIHFLNYNLGYIACQDGHVYKSTDGGDSWTFHGTGGAALYDMAFPPNSTSGWICGYYGHMHKVTPDGVSANIDLGPVNLNSLSFPDSSHGWTCGESIIEPYFNGAWAFDGGSYASGGKCVVFFLNDTLGWVGGDWDTIHKAGIYRYVTTGLLHTTDGRNYIEQYNPTKHGIWAIRFINEAEGWAGTYSGEILHTTDAGEHWLVDYGATMPGKFVRRILFVPEKQVIYILGNYGMLMKKGGVNGIPDATSTHLSLNISPNPIEQTAVISWQLVGNTHVVIKIYDAMGREVKTLLDENRMKGKHSIGFDAAGLPGGIYFCRMLSGNNLQTSKMMIIY